MELQKKNKAVEQKRFKFYLIYLTTKSSSSLFILVQYNIVHKIFCTTNLKSNETKKFVVCVII